MLRIAAGLAVVTVLAALSAQPARAQDLEAGALLLIMDASGSMNAFDDQGTRLLDGAKAALNRVVEELPDGSVVGLRVYGHRTPNTDQAAGCQDTELVVPVGPLDRPRMLNAIAGYQASGFTPIGLSLQQAASDLPPEGARTIVLVTDGEDTCAPPDPCQVARDLVAQGVDVRIETVGFFLQGNQAAEQQLQCIAEATGGSFRTADTADQLANELSELSARALREFAAGGTPVQGAPAAIEAPELEPGTYTDSVLPNEANWYGIELEEGQELVVTVTRAGIPGFVSALGNYTEVFYADPNLDEANVVSPYGYTREEAETNQAHTVRIRSGVVGSDPPPPIHNPNLCCLQPGTYAVRVVVEDNPINSIGDQEIPIELTFEVEDNAPASPSPTPSEAATSEAEAAQPPKPSPTPSAEADGGGISATTIIIALLAVLVLLMAAAIVILLRRQRPPGQPESG